ncbi:MULTISPECIES: aminotransferase class III-fold pyridoxal phosphate-dependent enzyme [unclassified Marinobacter]|uniref:aminotransferase family protein n=1 Tax=unclassified Marinobacter TaxID=83889 RepID=UPI00200BBE6A|nr:MULTISPECIES: aminotransferase class III-fold pyridoxal phosphate-dependent enzyme [unclassified Marinobacter]UQG55368.1 aminotransferase class III-fold pyridoxal phosphate-dependent enzyme [Marinobacter sp. M4C]UQG64172.1 aminotransferase class III-fold pyridoxal phosphate-dependent enzyme [Marinobacter sp. M2C]UQG68451.1 aminotransferase class III-fold pyridoxal phosphate-dependent enzyme [Marinobacter sp. M1C]
MSSSPLFYQAGPALPQISHGRGVFLWDTGGKEYLDGCSGAISCNLGHHHAGIRDAMLAQLDRVAFTYRTQFENAPAMALAQELVEMTDHDLEKVFFVSSGSESVESAIKLARQYFVARGESHRRHFVSLRPSYHGSTLGALGVTGYQPLEAPFADITRASIKVPGPDFYRRTETDDDAHVRNVLEETRKRIDTVGGENIIAVILEPVGGASTGARMVNRAYLEGIRELCDEIGCLLIYDEVLSGVGRTGTWFAYQNWGIAPDLLTTAKGLGAGYYPVGALLSRANIVDTVMANGGFQHGHTYAGNPLACATGLAVVETIRTEKLLDNVVARGAQLCEGMTALKARFDFVGNVRGIGLLWGMELVMDPVTKSPFPAEANLFASVTALAKEEGLLIYPRRTLNGLAGDHFLITPPLNISESETTLLLKRLTRTLHRLENEVVAPLLQSIAEPDTQSTVG